MLLLAAPRIAGLLPAPTTRSIGYSNRQMEALPKDKFHRMDLAVCRFLDQIVRFLNDDLSETQFNAANGTLYAEIKRIKSGNDRRSAPRTASPFEHPAVKAAMQNKRDLEDAALLKQKLYEMVGVVAQPTSGTVEVDGWRYQYVNWYPDGAIVISLRAPNGRTFIQGRMATNAATADEIKADLTKVFKARLNLFGPAPARADIHRPGEDGPLFAAIGRIEDADQTIDRLNKEAAANAARVAQADYDKSHPRPAQPAMPLLAGQTGVNP